MADGSLRIGRILGIDIELHWLFILLILAFVLFSPAQDALLWILLFVCVLIHELSHSVTALRNGVRVSRIILLPIGGVSVMDNPSTDPAVEFNIAMAGPIMSLFLGALFGVAVLFTPMGIATYIVQYLFLLNVLLGLFNIIPAFPMDGGRVLRSYLQKRMGLYRATMQTARISRYCMALIIIGSVAFVVWPSSYSLSYRYFLLLMDLVVVFFLYGGMKAEEDSVKLKQQTKGMKIAMAATEDYALVGYNSSIKSLYDAVRRKKEHIVLAKAPDGKYMLVNIFNKSALSGVQKVKDALIAVPNIDGSTGIADALGTIEQSNFRLGVVVSKGELVGIATSSHINAFLALHLTKKKGF